MDPRRVRRRSRIDWALALAATVGMFACDRADDRTSAADELLARVEQTALVFVPAPLDGDDRSFFVDRFEVTNKRFSDFLNATGYRPASAAGFLEHWDGASDAPADRRLMNHPVVFVSLDDARAFAAWRHAAIPTAEEWMRVAREVVPNETSSRLHMNARETDIGGTASVGTFESGRTRSAVVAPPVYDLFGNVREWTETTSAGEGVVITKGGSFADPLRNIRVDVDMPEDGGDRNHALGFRCVVRDASPFVRGILDRMTDLAPRDRERVTERLVEFDAPLARLLKRMRLKDAIAGRVSAEDGETDVFVALSDGRALRFTAGGDAFLLDGAQSVAQLTDLDECYHARAADLDGDGVEEIYVASHVVEAPIDDRIIEFVPGKPPTFVATGPSDRGGGGDRGEKLQWARADDSLAASFRDAFPAGEPANKSPIGWAMPRFRQWAVPRFQQTLRRIDVAAGALSVRWTVVVPYSEIVVPVATSHELLVPGLLWISRDAESVAARRILAPVAVDARTGAAKRLGLIPGGCASIALLAETPLRFLAVTDTAHVIEAERASDGLVARAHDRDPEHPDGDRVVRLEDGAALARASAPGRLELVHFDSDGREREHRTLEAGVDVGMHLLPLDGSEIGGGLLVREGGDRLHHLDAHLADEWTCDGLAHLDIGAVDCVVLAGHDGVPARVALPLDFDGFVAVDLARGRVLDRHAAPSAGLVTLVGLRGQRDELLVGFRGQGLFRVPVGGGVANDPAALLLNRLQPFGVRP